MQTTALRMPTAVTPPSTIDASLPRTTPHQATRPTPTAMRQSTRRTPPRDDETAWARLAQASNGFGDF